MYIIINILFFYLYYNYRFVVRKHLKLQIKKINV